MLEGDNYLNDFYTDVIKYYVQNILGRKGLFGLYLHVIAHH